MRCDGVSLLMFMNVYQPFNLYNCVNINFIIIRFAILSSKLTTHNNQLPICL